MIQLITDVLDHHHINELAVEVMNITEADLGGALLAMSIYLLSYYLTNKRSLHVCSQGLEISTLIGEKQKKIKLPTIAITIKISLKYPCI